MDHINVVLHIVIRTEFLTLENDSTRLGNIWIVKLSQYINCLNGNMRTNGKEKNLNFWNMYQSALVSNKLWFVFFLNDAPRAVQVSGPWHQYLLARFM